MMRMIQMKPLLYMLGAACLFSFTEITLKILNGSLNCLEVNFSRYTSGRHCSLISAQYLSW